MKGNHLLSLTLGLMAALAISGCSNGPVAGDVYSSAQSGVMQDVQFGTVLGVRNIIIEQNSSDTGQTAGGIIGAVAGSDIGKGRGQIVGGVLGAVAGGAIGSVIDRSAKAQPGVEITIKMDSGKTVAIVQLAGELFQPGEKVKVLTSENGKARVTH